MIKCNNCLINIPEKEGKMELNKDKQVRYVGYGAKTPGAILSPREKIKYLIRSSNFYPFFPHRILVKSQKRKLKKFKQFIEFLKMVEAHLEKFSIEEVSIFPKEDFNQYGAYPRSEDDYY